MSYVETWRSLKRFWIPAWMVLLMVGAGCSQDMLTDENNLVAAEEGITGAEIEGASKTSGTTKNKGRRYKGEEAEIWFIAYVSERLKNNQPVSEGEMDVFRKLQQRQEQRSLLRNGPAPLKGRQNRWVRGTGREIRPEGLDLEEVARQVEYPYIAFVSSRTGNRKKSSYRYALRGVRLSASVLEGAVGKNTVNYRYVARDAEGEVQVYVEARIPIPSRIRRGFTEGIRAWIAEHYGIGTTAGKTSGTQEDLNCTYDEEFDGYICEEIVVVCEGNYDDCNDGSAGGAPPDPVNVDPPPDEGGSGGSSSGGSNGDDGRPDLPDGAEETLNISVTASIVITNVTHPPQNTRTRVEFDAGVSMNIDNPLDFNVRRMFEASIVQNSKVIEGPDWGWESIGGGGSGITVSIPIPLPGYSHRYVKETIWEHIVQWENNDKAEAHFPRMTRICLAPEVERGWH